MTKSELRRAARILRDKARSLRESNIDRDGDWVGFSDYTVDEMQADYAELLTLARKLDAHARIVPSAKPRGL